MSKRTASKLMGALRVALLAAILGAGAVFWAVARARAYSERILEHLGQQMMQYAGARHQTAPEEVRVNGAAFFLSTGSVRAPVGEVLDRFYAKCLHDNGRVHDQWAEIASRQHVELPEHLGLWDGVYRSEAAHGGTIVCAQTREGRVPPRVMIQRIQQVLATGELSKLGELRYVYVTRDKDESVFVAMWTEGKVNYKTMFPPQADAPGEDPPGVPRPADTRRVLSAQPKGHVALVNIYRSDKLRSSELMDWYAQQLPAAGFSLFTKKAHFMVADDGRQVLTLTFKDDPRTGHGLTTIATQPD